MKFRIANPLAVFGFCGLLLIAATFYNAALAFINAHGLMIRTAHVAVAEMLIMLAAIGYIGLKIRAFPNIMAPFLFLVFMMMSFLFVSFWNEQFFIKSFRDMMIIAVFFLVGGAASERSTINTFRFMAIVILIFMVVENYMTEFYVSLFQPAKYYASTRGVEEFSMDESGLFRNSLGYAGRFSFGFLSKHRLSSIFLEQVSLANFSMVLAIFTCSFWSKLKRNDRILFFATIVLIILTNSSRTATLVCSLIFMGYFLFPMLPRYSHLLYMPVILIMAALFFYDPHTTIYIMQDDLAGRVGHTVYILSKLNSALFTGGTEYYIYLMMDSGYAYVLLTQTVFGFIAFWLFTSLIVPPSDPGNIRFNHSAALYIFLNLLIGAAIFSIKVSAPLWFVAGYLYHKKYAATPDGILYAQK